jgi:transcriptional regulator with XRE-family HTH domain
VQFEKGEITPMKKYTTSQRLKQIMGTRNLRQVEILELAEPYCRKHGVKLEKNALSQYVSGKVEPGQDKLTILGLALGVSEAWLMGYDVPAERNTTPTTNESNGRIQEFIELFGLLTAEQQSLIVHQIKGILSNQ